MSYIIRENTETINKKFTLTWALWNDGDIVLMLKYNGSIAKNYSAKKGVMNDVLNPILIEKMTPEDKSFYNDYMFVKDVECEKIWDKDGAIR